MKSSDRAYWVAWSQVNGVGPTLLMRLYRHFSSVETAWGASPSDLLAVEGIGLQTASAIAQARDAIDPATASSTHEQENPNFWTPTDTHYPRLLLEIPDPPPVLYYRGQVIPEENQGTRPTIAIVGTRSPSDYGRRWTRRIARALAQAGFSVVSGLAMGVDAIAHHSCLDVNGRTVAVVGTGVNIAYPWSNRKLAATIAERGLIVSEYPIGTKPAAPHFPQRNRIIAGLSRATLVLEAPIKSGALITARIANEYCRDVYALPGSLDEERAHGCLRLMSQGAHTILGETSLLEMLGAIPNLHTESDILFNQSKHQRSGTELGQKTQALRPNSATNSGPPFPQPSAFTPSPEAHSPSEPSIPLDPKARKVWDALPLHGPMPLDTIVETCQCPTGEILATLSQLELMGLVLQSPGMLYQRE